MIFLSAPAQAGILNIKEVTSPGGIKAWLVEDHTIPVISMRYEFRGSGSINDTPDKQGLTHLLSNTLDEGAGDLTSEKFQGILDDKSIGLSFAASRDDFGGNLKTLSKNKDTAFELLQLALTKPRFDKDAVDRMIAANLTRIRSDMTDPDWMLARLQNSIIFKDHPYTLNSGGTLSILPKITADDLRKKVKTDIARDRLIVSVAGDISEADLGTALDKIFGTLPATSAKNSVKDVTLPTEGSTTLLKLDIPQTLIAATLPGVRMDDPDYFASDVMDFILGSSGFGSRLTEVVREQHGLTYGIYTDMDMMDHTALFNLSTSSRNDVTSQVIDLSKQEFIRMVNEDVTEAEIKDAKSYLIGSTALSLTSTDQIAGMMLAFQEYKLPKNYLDIRADAINKITAADVRRVSKRLLNTDKMTIVLVGNPKNITPTKTVTDLPNVK